jgi:hypothetical protein
MYQTAVGVGWLQTALLQKRLPCIVNLVRCRFPLSLALYLALYLSLYLPLYPSLYLPSCVSYQTSLPSLSLLSALASLSQVDSYTNTCTHAHTHDHTTWQMP